MIEALNTMPTGLAVVGTWRPEDVAGYTKLVSKAVGFPDK